MLFILKNNKPYRAYDNPERLFLQLHDRCTTPPDFTPAQVYIITLQMVKWQTHTAYISNAGAGYKVEDQEGYLMFILTPARQDAN